MLLGSNQDRRETALGSGIPTYGELEPDTSNYYSFTATDPSLLRLTFQLTPITGDSDLYVSTSMSNPTNYTAEKSSSNVGKQVDTVVYVKGEDAISLNGLYHIGIWSAEQATYTLTVEESFTNYNTTTLLLPNTPQEGTVFNAKDGDYKIYEVSVAYEAESARPLKFMLSPSQGKFSLYVASSFENWDIIKQSFAYNWCLCEDRQDEKLLVIDPLEPRFKLKGTYLILVKATDFQGLDSASYTLLYFTGEHPVWLTDGQPFYDSVEISQYNYYKLEVRRSRDLSIIITAETGDPDLYVNINKETLPDRLSHDFAGIGFGSEVLYLPKEDIRLFCEMTERRYCVITVGVFGYTKSSYSIRLSIKEAVTPMNLPQGEPIVDFMVNEEYKYYYAIVDSHRRSQVVLQPLANDTDLFANLFDYEEAGTKTRLWRRPSLNNHQFASTGGLTTERIVFNVTTLMQSCPSDSCLVLTSVLCYGLQCQYSITSSYDSVKLLDKVPYQDFVQINGEQTYEFYCDRNATDILITLTALGGGDPDLYVSRGKVPNVRNSTWESTTWEGEALAIKPDDPFFKGKSMKGTYHILVVGKTEAHYTIVVNIDLKPVTQLLQGQPQQGYLSHISENYYYFANSYDKAVTITLTPLYGTAFMRANPQSPATGDIYAFLPKRLEAQWSSMQDGVKNTLVIPTTDEKFCYNCNLLIGVYSSNTNCSYSIEVSSENKTQILHEGVPHRDEVEKAGWRHYLYTSIEFTAEIVISLTSYSGDADLYVAKDTGVSDTQFKWRATSTDMVETVVIPSADREGGQGNYFIGVYGVKGSTFSIVAFNRHNYVTLTSGAVQHHQLQYSSSSFVRFQIFGEDAAECSLQVTDPKLNPNVYINFHPKGKNVPIPGPEYSEDMYEDEKQFDNSFHQLRFNLKWKGPGKFDMAVYGTRDTSKSSIDKAAFSIVCFTGFDFITIKTGSRVFSNLGLRKTRRYEVMMPETGVLEVFVEHCLGRVEVHASQNYTLLSDPGLMATKYPVKESLDLISISVDAGRVYLSITATIVETSHTNSSHYQMYTRVRSQHADEPPVLMPGDSGRLAVDKASKDEYIVSWTHPDGVASNNMMYQVIAYKDDLEMNSVCSVEAWRDSGYIEAQVDIIGKDSGQVKVAPPFYVTVVAATRNYSLPIIASTLYNTAYVEDSDAEVEGGSPWSTWVFLGCIGLVAILVIAWVAMRVVRRKQGRRVHGGYEMGSLLRE